MNKAIMFSIIGILSVLLITVSILYLTHKDSSIVIDNSFLPTDLRDMQFKQLQWNNVTLTDSTVYNNVTNVCTANRYGMNITISPCVAYDILGDNIVQDVVFKWTGATQRNISWIFVYEHELQSGKIEAYVNQSIIANDKEYNNTWINNYLVDSVVSYTNLGVPDNRCEIGNLNNTQMYEVIRATNGNQSTTRYCFTSLTTVNATSFRISGNAFVAYDVQKTVYQQRYVDVTNQVQYLGKGLLNDSRSYYKVEDVQFNPGQEIVTRWTYTPVNKTKAGKWHILGYDSNTGLVDSVTSEQYLYIDPWWSASWSRRKEINITGAVPTNYSLQMNITKDNNMNADYSDLRFTDIAGTTELPYWIESYDSNNATVWVLIQSNDSFYVYYGNAGATTTSSAKTAFEIGDDFSAASLDTAYWDVATDSVAATSYNTNTISGWLNVSNLQEGKAITSYITIVGNHSWKMRMASIDIANSRNYIGFWGTHTVLQDRGGGANALFLYHYQPDKTVNGMWSYGTSGQATDPNSIVARNGWTLANNVTYSAYFNNTGSQMCVALTCLNKGSNDGAFPTQTATIPFRFTTRNIAGFPSAYVVDYVIVYKWLPVVPTAAFGTEETQAGMIATLSSPPDNAKLNYTRVSMIFNITANALNVSNYTLTLYNTTSTVVEVFNGTPSEDGSVYDLNYTTDLYDDVFQWKVKACGNDSDGVGSCVTSNNFTFIIDTTAPALNITLLNNVTAVTFPVNVTLNYTASDARLDDCWYNSTMNATIVLFPCNTTRYLPIQNSSYTGQQRIYIWANDTLGNTNSTSAPVYIYYLVPSANHTNFYAVEGTRENFWLSLNMTMIGNFNPVAWLRWNNTDYGPATVTNINMNSTYLNYTLSIPDVSIRNTRINWTWYYNISGDPNAYNFNISGFQNYSWFRFGYCNTTLNFKVLNITFIDETTLLRVNATIDNSLFTYFRSASVNKTLTYINTTHAMEFWFCAYPQWFDSFSNDYYIQYSKTDGGTYPQRTTFFNETEYNSSITSKTLYLLNYNNGLTSSYNVVTIGNQIITDVYVRVERVINGQTVLISDGYTDSAGTISFFLNPNYEHTFTFSKPGYTTQTQTIKPTQTAYTITMGSSTNYFYYTDALEGISYTIWPPSGIVRDGNYNFTLKVYSRSSNILNCSFYIYNETQGLIGSAAGCNSTTTTNGGTAFKMINLTGVNKAYGQYFVTLDSGLTYRLEGDAQWKNVNISNRAYWTSIRSAINDSINLPEWGDNPQTTDFSRIVFFFLILAITLAILNFFTGYDTAYPGAFIYVMTAIVVIMSAINGVAGPGFFYLDVIQGRHSIFGGFTSVINNWILPVHFVMLSFIYFFTTQKRYQSG